LLRELCEECGIAYNLRPLTEADVRHADEVLLSSATSRAQLDELYRTLSTHPLVKVVL